MKIGLIPVNVAVPNVEAMNSIGRVFWANVLG